MSLINSTQSLSRKNAFGFTLIEILIALVILSIGLLGVASLQMQGLRNNQSAYLRSQASMLVYDMADRMRVNAARAITGDYDGFNTDTYTPADPACIDQAAGCSAINQSRTDLFEWAQQIEGTGNAAPLLPDARGTIVRGAGTLFTVSVVWKETAWDSANTVNSVLDQTFSINFSL